jgi:hypothetical protein
MGYRRAIAPYLLLIYYLSIFYFEGVSSSVSTAGGRRIDRGNRVVVGTPAGEQGSDAVGVACLG